MRDERETTDKNPQSWAAWKYEADQLRAELSEVKAELAEAQSLIKFLNEHCDAAWDLVDADADQLERIKQLVYPKELAALRQQAGEPTSEIVDSQCPVCGYYCLGNGGVGCIDKPAMLATMQKGIEK